MAQHPYQSLPDHAFWRRAIAAVAPEQVDPVIRAPFKIGKADAIATAGSCFAQHIAQHLKQSGFNYLVTESAHPSVAHLAGPFNYGVFTARYGNIYTSRQFVQTLQRAYGLFTPRDNAWPAGDGRTIDPYRPQIQPNGFACLAELTADREQHFAAIRRAVETLDMLVFTLGLTETWMARADGAAYPLCPGVAGGVFDPAQHEFVNLGVDDVVRDITDAISLIRSRNPKARVILTVSPVPLIATMEDRSVLVSTTYSKSVLRVAAEMIAQRHPGVAYFPSYEIITGAFNRGRYYGEDLRDVTPEGVAHVMRLFMRHYAADADIAETSNDGASTAGAAQPANDATRRARADRVAQNLQAMAAVICDEIALDPVHPPAPGPTAPVAAQPGSAMAYLRAQAAAPPETAAPETAAPETAAPNTGAPEPARSRGLFSWARRR